MRIPAENSLDPFRSMFGSHRMRKKADKQLVQLREGFITPPVGGKAQGIVGLGGWKLSVGGDHP